MEWFYIYQCTAAASRQRIIWTRLQCCVGFWSSWNIDHWPLPPCSVHDQQPASHFILNLAQHAHLQTAALYIINGLAVAQNSPPPTSIHLLPLSAVNQYELQSKLAQLIKINVERERAGIEETADSQWRWVGGISLFIRRHIVAEPGSDRFAA